MEIYLTEEPEESIEERRRLWEAEDKVIRVMNRAIADGVLTKAERAEIEEAKKELRGVIEGDGIITDSEKKILEKVDKTFHMILKIEKDFISSYWKTRKK